jgi:hypothetical protein
VNRTEGACTISPHWETVTGLNYFSQFSPQLASLIGPWWRAAQNAYSAVDKERQRRIAAEQKLKELCSRKPKKEESA